MGTSWHSSQKQSLYPYAIYCIYSTSLIPNVSLDPSGVSPFSSADVQGLDTEKGNCGTTSPGRCTTLQKWRWESGRTFMWGLPPPHPFTDWHTPAVLSSELLRSALMMRHTALWEPLSREYRSSRPPILQSHLPDCPWQRYCPGLWERGRRVLAWIIYTASFFLRTDMIPGLGCLQILMVVYIICRYRFFFSSSFLYFLLWLCQRLMADVLIHLWGYRYVGI